MIDIKHEIIDKIADNQFVTNKVFYLKFNIERMITKKMLLINFNSIFFVMQLSESFCKEWINHNKMHRNEYHADFRIQKKY